MTRRPPRYARRSLDSARRRLLVATAATASVLLAGCAAAPEPGGSRTSSAAAEPRTGSPTAEPSTNPMTLLPGMPPPLDPADVYAADRPGNLAPATAPARPLVYVPNFGSDTLSVIDPRTYKVIRTVAAGHGPQHVVPSWDLRTLWINDNTGNTLIPINPATGRLGRPVAVADPYNLYFTPDGRFAMVMAESRGTIVFSDPHTMAPRRLLPVGCAGVNHADFSADGRYFIATCEFSGDLVKVDTAAQRVTGRLHLPGHAMPQDIKISPDGRTWYVADMQTSGLWVIDGDRMAVRAFIPTGDGAHGLYVSRDSRYLYVANRGAGSVSVLDFRTGRVVVTWRLPGHASPDMGGVSADGRVLWLSGRYDHEVYAIDTATGHLIARIPVGTEPHGLCVWPQPGRYSLGHTGILR